MDKKRNPRRESLKKAWYKFSKDPLAITGLAIIAVIVIGALFATHIGRYPEDAGLQTHIDSTLVAPNADHWAGTDSMGRDIFSRMLIGLRYSLITSVIVLGLSVPFGVSLGLLAGYYRNTWVETLIMRFTELFMSIPTLVTSMVICTIGSGGWLLGAISISVSWWAWYCRLVYNSVRSVSNELYITYTELSGVKVGYVVFGEILPNIVSPILTKMSLDVGTIIITSSSLSFLGLGLQPPTPSLGSMVSDGVGFLPQQWWVCLFPAFLIVLIVMGFNLFGDGLGNALSVEDQ